MLFAQPNDRQQHVKTVGDAERHAVFTALTRDLQRCYTGEHEPRDPDQRPFNVIAVTDQPFVRGQPYVVVPG